MESTRCDVEQFM